MPPRIADWNERSDEELLDARLCDLGVQIEEGPLAPRIDRLHLELKSRGLRFRPHVWLSSEWFSPDGVPGFAAPFYLAHPRLARLERTQMGHVEGGAEDECMRLLRHEAGHAIGTAYRLHRRKAFAETFGRWSTPYQPTFRPRPHDRRFVIHLDLWYAQSHPAEDFAETFAIWLSEDWEARYADWPAIEKLRVVDGWMREVGALPPAVRCREQTERLATLTTTLAEHYRRKRARYKVGGPAPSDALLSRLFVARRRGTPAGAFLRRNRAKLARATRAWSGHLGYTVDDLIRACADRADALELKLRTGEDEALAQAASMLTVQLMNHLHGEGFRLAR